MKTSVLIILAFAGPLANVPHAAGVAQKGTEPRFVRVSYEASGRAEENSDHVIDEIRPDDGTFEDEFPRSVSIFESDETSSANVQLNAEIVQNSATRQIDGSLSGSIDISGNASGQFSLEFYFNIDSRPGPVTIDVDTQATASSGVAHAEGRFSFCCAEEGIFAQIEAVSDRELDDSDNFDMTYNFEEQSGGGYFLEIAASAGSVFDTNNGNSEATVDINVTFTLGGSPVEEIFWSMGDGQFDVPENWEPAILPTNELTAVFDETNQYSVFFSAGTAESAVVERGVVTFQGGSLTLDSNSNDDPNVIVGNTAIDLAQLTLAMHTLNGSHGQIARNSNTTAEVIVGEGSVWNNQGRLTVGEDGTGSLQIEAGGRVSALESRIGFNDDSSGTVHVTGSEAKGVDPQWTTGNIAVGLGGNGELNIDNGFVSSDAVFLGVDEESEGSATVGGSSGRWDWDGESFVGNAGTGTLTIENGGIAGPEGELDVFVGNEPGSVGTLNVTGDGSLFGTLGELRVGNQGDGLVIVEDGAALIVAALLVGGDSQTASSTGEVRISGSSDPEAQSVAQILGDVRIGRAGEGHLILSESAEMSTNGSADIGVFSLADASVTVDAARWTILGTLAVGELPAKGSSAESTLTVANQGIVSSSSATLGLGGVIHLNSNGSLMFDESALQLVGGQLFIDGLQTIPPKGPATFGTLIDGDVNVEAGEVVFEIGGNQPGEFTSLEVSGDVTFLGGTIVLRFVNNYSPRMGDTVALLSSGGMLDLGGATFEQRGLAEGFRFNLTNQQGSLMFEAQEDAMQEPAEEGEGEGQNEAPVGCAAGSFSTARTDTAVCVLVLCTLCFLSRRDVFLYKGKRQPQQAAHWSAN